MTKETYTNDKRRPTHTTNETDTNHKRNLHLSQMSLAVNVGTRMTKETYTNDKRDLHDKRDLQK